MSTAAWNSCCFRSAPWPDGWWCRQSVAPAHGGDHSVGRLPPSAIACEAPSAWRRWRRSTSNPRWRWRCSRCAPHEAPLPLFGQSGLTSIRGGIQEKGSTRTDLLAAVAITTRCKSSSVCCSPWPCMWCKFPTAQWIYDSTALFRQAHGCVGGNCFYRQTFGTYGAREDQPNTPKPNSQGQTNSPRAKGSRDQGPRRGPGGRKQTRNPTPSLRPAGWMQFR